MANDLTELLTQAQQQQMSAVRVWLEGRHTREQEAAASRQQELPFGLAVQEPTGETL